MSSSYCKWLFISTCLFGTLFIASFNGWSRGGGGCFEQGTLIATPQGSRAIEQLHPGDWVWGNVQGKHTKAKVVSTSKVNPGHYLELKLATGLIHVTKEHLFATKQGEFHRAANLRPGDKVIIWQSNQWKTEPIIAITSIKSRKPAFNLLVDSGATYLANEVLVHNKGCFLPNTPILLTNGSSRAIDQIHPGDQVQAYDVDGTIVTTKVRAVLKHQVNSYYVVSTKTTVTNVTGEHPFYIGHGEFKTVESLHPGDLIYTFDGKKLKREVITHIAQINGVTTVFNLQTDEPHTYFAAGVAVHNKGGGGGGCFPAGTKIKTPAGNKAIELLAPGDWVVSINRNGQKFPTRVQSTFVTRSKVLSVKTNSGNLHTTEEHPIARQNGSFVPAGQLKVHDVLLVNKAKGMQPAIVQSLHSESEQVVFNLSVSSPHTFIADNFLVHNKGGIGFRGGSSGNDSDSFILYIIIGIFLWAALKGKWEQTTNLDYNYSRKTIEKKSLQTVKLLDFIARQDETMKPDELKRLVHSTFFLLQESWMRRNYAPMEQLLMPDLFHQHSQQIEGMIRNHEINRIDRLQILNIDFVNVRYTEKKYQREFTALISASARDYYVDDRTRKYIRGDLGPETFQEFWTFQLQDSAWKLREIEQSRESDYLKEENFCELFTDGQIEKIYQNKVDNLGTSGPWLPKNVEVKVNKVERMLNFLVQSDKIWDKQTMLNRVRLVFTNIHLALEAGELTPAIEAQLYPSIAEQFNQTIGTWKAQDNSIEYRNFCVRKIDIVLVKSFNDKTKNEFTARVAAHAQRIQRQNGRVLTQDKEVTPFEEYWTFGLLDEQWKLKDVMLKAQGKKALGSENLEESSSPDLVKWYYTKKRAL
ncbi:polymorphic toxin-type HINT domain-containing protein [Legionella fallonii]|uniref:Uncharacterized protein n=1 Tax=Legionella fallonii LLAP-10 TaxID=1212491 RepID=A0A098G601_9GAMM|nr:polymorphic toxin-type HINT domain-containing protein [Legionella fallonii]CEG57399.1 protein of unknown function [Legionella fallonii LLAP-10]